MVCCLNHNSDASFGRVGELLYLGLFQPQKGSDAHKPVGHSAHDLQSFLSRTLAHLLMAASSRRLIYPAIGIYAFGTYGALLFFRSQQADGVSILERCHIPAGCRPCMPTSQSCAGQEAESKPGRTWDEISDDYDGELGRDETVMGMKLCRWWLVRQAKVQLVSLPGRALLYCWRPGIHDRTCTSWDRGTS